MPYYPKSNFRLLGFQKSNKKNKMYDALIMNKHLQNINKVIFIPFGDKNYQNYHDLTGLNKYPNLIHGEEKRRNAYRARAKHNLKDGYFSPSYFSYFYLW